MRCGKKWRELRCIIGSGTISVASQNDKAVTTYVETAANAHRCPPAKVLPLDDVLPVMYS